MISNIFSLKYSEASNNIKYAKNNILFLIHEYSKQWYIQFILLLTVGTLAVLFRLNNKKQQ